MTRHQSRERDLAERQRADDERGRLRPALPPLEMIERHEQREDDRLRNLLLEAPIAVAVSISPRNSAVSHPARF